MQGLLDWLSSLPLAGLYAMLGVIAAVENIFPPIPADTVVAFGSFLAARGQGSMIGAFLATWIGNIGGATLMYALGRRYGAERIQRRLLGKKGGGADERLKLLYGRYGIAALFVSRFLPGIRAIVPPFAGALHIPPLIAIPTIAIASGLWYGSIAYLAFNVGSNWDAVVAVIAKQGKIVGSIAVVLALIGGGIWWLRSRRRKT
jgi:membrane protein DedA with SNARE-associated domain